VIAIGTGVSVGGNGVDVGGIGVGEPKTTGKFGVPLEQAVRTSANITRITFFEMNIPSIIPEEPACLLRQTDCKYNSAIPVFGKLK
jgi:hypothetical protein